jgi:hypothetical protein
MALQLKKSEGQGISCDTERRSGGGFPESLRHNIKDLYNSDKIILYYFISIKEGMRWTPCSLVSPTVQTRQALSLLPFTPYTFIPIPLITQRPSALDYSSP